MEKTKTKMIIGSVRVVKTGTSLRDGRKWNWAIQEVVATSAATGKKGTFSTFDNFSGREGQEIECEIWKETNEKNGKVYENWKIALPKRNVWEAIGEIERRLDVLEKENLAPGGGEQAPEQVMMDTINSERYERIKIT